MYKNIIKYYIIFIADYYLATGEGVPFKQFGYANLYDFLLSIDRVYTRNIQGNIVLAVTPTESTAHLSKLVEQQKSKKQFKKVDINFLFKYFSTYIIHFTYLFFSQNMDLLHHTRDTLINHCKKK